MMRALKFGIAALAAAAIVGVPSVHAQSNPCKTVVKHHKAKKDEMPCEDLRKQLADQQAEIDALKQQLADMPKPQPQQPETDPIATPLAEKAQQTANNASAQAADADTKATDADAKAVAADKKVDALHDEVYSPAALHYKGITITPGGFVAAEGVWREHAVNSDINTPLNSIPFPSSNEGHVSELNFSGRQSRLSVLAQAKPNDTTQLTGYYEMDFLGTGTSSNNNQSNSYVLRQRQIWGQYMNTNGFAITGGQMWSLVTEDRRGTDARTEIQPQTIDPQYLVGYSWTRQPGFRVQQRWGDLTTNAFTVAASVEQAQITNFTVASNVSASIPANYFFGAPGQNGGLYNAAISSVSCSSTSTTTPVSITCANSSITTYANNVVPDFIVKAAYDAPAFHVEVGGIARFFRDYYLPVTASGGTAAAPTYTYATTYSTNTKGVGGVFGSARAYLFDKHTEVAVQAMAGQGVGRYGSSQLADATLRPDETLEPIRNYHGLFSLENHITPKFDVFAYYGGEYAQRTVYTTAQGDFMGYAVPVGVSNAGCYNLPAGLSSTVGNTGSAGSLSGSSCSEPTRYIQEGMIGFQWRPISSPKYGKLQYSVTYSYIQRNLWASYVASTTTPSGPRAEDSMIHVQMRYYIP